MARRSVAEIKRSREMELLHAQGRLNQAASDIRMMQSWLADAESITFTEIDHARGYKRALKSRSDEVALHALGFSSLLDELSEHATKPIAIPADRTDAAEALQKAGIEYYYTTKGLIREY